MTELAVMKCEACRADAPRVSDAELPELMRQIPDWTPMVRDGILQLERSYKFKNFKLAWAFHQQVAELAEAEGHHPTITTSKFCGRMGICECVPRAHNTPTNNSAGN